MIELAAELQVERLGRRGEGIARRAGGSIVVPYALPGERVRAEVDGERGRLVEVLAASPERIAPFCPYYTRCGGCAVQAYAPAAYAEWKRDLVVSGLRAAGLSAEVGPLVDAHGAGRRRATFHARRDGEGAPRLGFMAARSHDLVAIDACPLFAPGLATALAAARRIAAALVRPDGVLDLHVTASDTGLDVDLQGHGRLGEAERRRLIEAALAADVARLSNHGTLVVERRSPKLRVGPAELTLPPGVFLQATAAGETAIADRTLAALGAARRVADLFAGIGPFALRLVAGHEVHAVDLAGEALAALTAAARTVPRARPPTTAVRDLFKRPLEPAELAPYDAVVFDPPRAGAERQAHALAAAQVPTVVAVSCNVESFCRDSVVLVRGGYVMERVDAIDQFRHSPHLEIVAVFRHPGTAAKTRRRLLG